MRNNIATNGQYHARLLSLKTAVVVLLAALILGCASSGNVPIESRAEPASQKNYIHVVQAGDTLYSIAWRYEKDVKDLAAINAIKAPYVIFQGQRLRLSGKVVASASAKVKKAIMSVTAKVATPVAAKPAKASTTASLPSSVGTWSWPISGKLVESFGKSGLKKGVVLDSSEHKSVKSAAEGVVVYAGSGVRGYGNFLIVKHSDLFLSAYAYNEEIIVKEGDQLRKGQQIAVAGRDMDGQPRLYFEIRKNGKPVDPLKYLPKR